MTTQSQALAPTNQTLMAAISNPGALGTIEAYIAAVNRLPVLTQMHAGGARKGVCAGWL